MPNSSNHDKSNTQDLSKMNLRERKAKRRAARTFTRTFLYAMMVLILAIFLAVFVIKTANDALGFVKPSSEVEVYIEKGASVDEISSTLHEAGIVKYEWAFKLFTTITKSKDKFKSGTYTLNTDMDYLEVVTRLKQTPKRETVDVTITEGKELREIAEIMEKNGVCSAESFLTSCQNDEFDYDFINALPDRENRMEGYLFPDTYQFYKDEDPKVVIKKFLNNFKKKYDEELRARTEELGMTIDEVITLASIIEREAAGDEDRGKVSSVFHNRLDSKELPYLQSCATVQYILQERKSVLSIADTKIDSPYNTYLYKGLPPGPIAAPGLASIKAALYPEDTDYYYFVVNADGKHLFAKTLKEHEANIKKANSSQGTGTVIE